MKRIYRDVLKDNLTVTVRETYWPNHYRVKITGMKKSWYELKPGYDTCSYIYRE